MYSRLRNISIACILSVALGASFQTAITETGEDGAFICCNQPLFSMGNLAKANETFSVDVASWDSNLTGVSNHENDVENHGMGGEGDGEEWPLEGVWITSIPTPLGNMIVKNTWVEQDVEQKWFMGEFEQINTFPLLFDLYPDLEQLKYGGGVAAKIGLNQYEITTIQYFTKTNGPSQEEIVGVGVITGTIEFLGPDRIQGQGTGAYYMPAQDADQDGLPDEGQEPVICIPWEWSAKRLTITRGCVPMPLPQESRWSSGDFAGFGGSSARGRNCASRARM